ncbi:hypothetical protein SLUN_23825 [Streptomyces lunaelactis]|uniref:AG1 protein n=1 Tax=Streptomyces lunaelactis TaxID=1535768 RepID=A0A2R4T6M5_9ACTN|nr:hypothetical protein [Streptomyces lunaelactis]AVZ74746.1 hypothetical protein SLUN_23825 [Streptomyces lunaelactis]NUK83880.1 hypothetical protein [Streptomyces lunaelactis]
MAWEEWAQIKAEVADRHAFQMQLNQLAPAGGGGSSAPDLASSPAKKQAAVKAINDALEPGVVNDGKHTAESVNAAVKEFGARDGYGWDTSGALKKAHEAWAKQVKTLLDRLATEKSLLSTTTINFQNNDLDIAAQMARHSRIDDY